MIVDEILDAKYNNNKVDVEYIKKSAQLMGFNYITKALDTKDNEKIKQALSKYIIDNGYNYKIINTISKLKF